MWTEIEELANKYKDLHEEIYIEEILRRMKKYCYYIAIQSNEYGNQLQINIPVEDFYSEFLFVIWKGVEFYATTEGESYTIKNIILMRLNIAKKNIWRKYKKKILNMKN